MTKCPFLRAANAANEYDPNWSGDDCMKGDCELYNDWFGRCSFAVDAYLKGRQESIAERQMLKKGG